MPVRAQRNQRALKLQKLVLLGPEICQDGRKGVQLMHLVHT